jgi:hypothetical protein
LSSSCVAMLHAPWEKDARSSRACRNTQEYKPPVN